MGWEKRGGRGEEAEGKKRGVREGRREGGRLTTNQHHEHITWCWLDKVVKLLECSYSLFVLY